MYGPLWIVITLVIELCILGHLTGLIKLHSTLDPTAPSYVNSTLLAQYANNSLSKMFKTLFLITLFAVVTPFISYISFKNKGALEVTFVQMLQIYGYSLVGFIPLALVSVALPGFYRLKIVLLLATGACSLYYTYKETIETAQKYFDHQTLKYYAYYITAQLAVFMLSFRYYCLGV